MRLLLDEMLSPAIARELRERGHDVLAIADHLGWVALSDPDVMTLARTERRAVLTNNLRDYRPLHAEAITPGGPGHFGMIFMPGTYRRTKQDTGRIIAALESKLTEYPGDEDLANGECWLLQRCSCRKPHPCWLERMYGWGRCCVRWRWAGRSCDWGLLWHGDRPCCCDWPTSVTNVFALLRLLPMSNRDKDAEILALCHQLSVLRRQLGPDRVRFTPGDRALLVAL